MQEKSFSKIKKQNPVSIIVHATNIVGSNLAKILLEQGSKVILIDRFDSKSKELILQLKKLGDVDFVDITGIEDLMKNIGRVDYLFYLQSEFLLSNTSFTSKDFLEESNNLNLCLKVGQKYNSKFTLLTSIFLNEKLTHTIQYASSYSPEELQKYSETLTAEYHDKSKMNARILRIGAILGQESNIEQFKTLNQLFEDSVKNTTINIAGEGLDIHYLIHISDLVYGILKLTFSSLTNGEVISLCNPNDYTTLSIAYKLLELNPNATEIKFVPNSEKKSVLHSQYIPAPNAQEYGWKQRKTLEKSVSETLQQKYKKYKKKWQGEALTETTYQKKLEEIRAKKTSPKRKKGHTNIVATPTGEAFSKALNPLKQFNFKGILTPKNTFKYLAIFLILFLIFYFLAYPIISISAGSFSAYRRSRNVSQNLADFDKSTIEKELTSINRDVRNINKSFAKLNWLFFLIQKDEMYSETSMLLHGLGTGSEGLITLADGIQPLISYLNEFEPALGFQDTLPTTTREYTNILKDLEKNSNQVAESAYKVSQSLKIITNVDKEKFPNSLQPRLEEIQEIAFSFEKQIDPISNVIAFLPDSLGANERKRYLILLQNPGELRSTGGWISSYAILGIEGGQIRELIVDDVYNLDGELKNQQKFFEAPKDILNALEVEELSLSLSNWDPNFPNTAKSSSFFVKEAGKANKIDGVIAIDIYLLQDLLDLWDGIYIPGEKDLITSDNIYEKVFFLHENFAPGQSQKATFLTSLADEVIKEIFSSNFEENTQVFTSLLNSLESKNMLLYFENMDAQKFFSQKGWSGEISSEKYSFAPFSIEWNWGANKANLYLDREQKVRVDIESLNEISYEYSLVLTNNSTAKTYPQGDYENYLRVYIPEEAEITEVNGFVEDEYSTSYTKGFQVLSGWFNIPTKTTRELTVNYTLNNFDKLFETQGNDIFLSSKLFKQPGTSKEDLMRIEIIYPPNWGIVEEGEFDRTRTNLIKQITLDKEKSLDLKWTFQ